MLRIVDMKQRYLFLAPVILLIGFSFLFANLNNENEAELLNEKLIGMSREVNLVAASIHHCTVINDNWDAYAKSNVIYLTEALEQINSMYGIVYNEKFNIVTKQLLPDDSQDDGSKFFNPLQFNEFMDMAKNNTSGTLVLPYDRGHDTVPIHLYFQWTSFGNENKHRLLICAGVMDGGTQTPLGKAMTIGMVAMIGVTFLLNMILIGMIAQIGKDCRCDAK